jgi:hypothetical protein
MPKPINTTLYAKVKAEADKKFLAPTSIYRSAWIVREYKKRGGTYRSDGKPKGLTQWFAEDWVDLNRPNRQGFEKCGRQRVSTRGTYPLCRPQLRVAANTPRTVNELKRTAIAAAKISKQKIKHQGRVKF